MIDLHTHILWGLDDGARTITDSLEMCRIAYRDGIRTIVATPHTLNGIYQNDRTSILTKVQELNSVISKQLSVNSSGLSYQSSVNSSDDKSRITNNDFPITSNESPITNPQSRITNNQSLITNPRSAIRNPKSQIRNPKSEMSSSHGSQSEIRNPKSKIPLSYVSKSEIPPGRRPLRAGGRNPKSEILILPGADVHLNDQTIPQLDGRKVTTIGDKGKCLLLEFPFTGIPYGAEEVLHQVISRGIIPIISHPERNLEIAQNPGRYYEMIRMGCLGQVTAMSLTNGFGPGVGRLAEQLLSKGLIHIIASDAHSTDGRPPVLFPAVCAAAKIVGEEEALKMVTEYPQSIIKGQKPIRQSRIVNSY